MRVTINGLFIESEELDKLSHVTDDENTLGFQIKRFINVFEVFV